MSTSLFLGDLSRITSDDITDFLGVDGPEESRPPEGLRIDYKEKVDADPIGEVATAFANSSGGLIFVGVSESQTRPVAALGVEVGRSDLKTRLGNIILNAIYPTPAFSIGTAPIADAPGREVAVIRIKEGEWPPYMWTAGRRNKVAVRREDQCGNAGPLELESLFSRRGRTANTIGGWADDDEFVPRRCGQTPVACEHYLRMTFRPIRPLLPVLHQGIEERTQRQLWRATHANLTVTAREERQFELEAEPGWESQRWRISEGGQVCVAHGVAKCDEKNNCLLFLPELVVDLIRVVRGVRYLFEDLGGYGRLAVRTVCVLRDVRVLNAVPPGTGGLRHLNGIESLSSATAPGSGSVFETHLEHAELEDAAPFLAQVLLRHLRAQRAADIHLDKLTAAVRALDNAVQ